MAINWSASLAVGIKQIDDEHKELFERINALLAAMVRGDTKADLKPLIGFLAQYVKVHFSGEELLMTKHRYPGAAENARQHAAFVVNFKEVAAKVEKSGPNPTLTIELNRLLCGWLRDHITTIDKKFGQFLNASGATPRA